GAADARRAVQLGAEAAAEAAELGMSLPAVDVRGGRSPGAPVAVCTRAGRRWRVEVGGRSTVVDDMVGMRHLEVLIANQDVDIPALDLASTRRGLRMSLSPQRVLDEQAVRQYRARLRDLAVAVEGALAAGEQERVASLRAEAEWLGRELGVATGLAGRPRRFADDAERARIAVGKAIRRALEKVAAADAVIGAELLACVETGAVCCYRPGSGAAPTRTVPPALTPGVTAVTGPIVGPEA
ncbi:MAG TPA: hypothetical protein VHN80_16875, partial [Kineosporiaceae bacterium]|nr:hypothetical protein [Kineosporiaceae bacterium]